MHPKSCRKPPRAIRPKTASEGGLPIPRLRDWYDKAIRAERRAEGWSADRQVRCRDNAHRHAGSRVHEIPLPERGRGCVNRPIPMKCAIEEAGSRCRWRIRKQPTPAYRGRRSRDRPRPPFWLHHAQEADGSETAGSWMCSWNLPGKRMMGLEPTTFCMASRRSSQLSYIRMRGTL